MSKIRASMFEISNWEKITWIFEFISITVLLILKISVVFIKRVKLVFHGDVRGPTRVDIPRQVVLVVNYNDGLGKAIADELLKNGCVVCTTTDKIVTKVESKSHPKYREYKLNADSYDEVLSLKSRIEKEFGSVDLLIMLPTDIPKMRMLEAMSGEFQDAINKAFKTYIWALKCFSDGMMERKRGHFVAVSPVFDKTQASNIIRRVIAGIFDSFNMELQLDKEQFISTTLVRRQSDICNSEQWHTEEEVNKLMTKQILHGIARKQRFVDISNGSLKRLARDQPNNIENSLITLKMTFRSFLKAVLLFATLLKNCITKILHPTQDKHLLNQVALVTGGAMGLGRQIALELAKESCQVAIADVDFEEARKTAEDLTKLNVKAKAYKADVSNLEDVKKLRLDIQKDFGTVDILVNNAGLIPVARLSNARVETIEKTIKVNLLAHLLIVETFLQDMINQKRGHIVATCSIAGLIGLPMGITYTGTKFGVVGFMDALEADLCENNHKFIKTTTIYPWVIRTRQDIKDFIDSNNAVRLLPGINPVYAAQRIVQGILQNERRVIIPNLFKIALFLDNSIPIEVQDLTRNLLLSGLREAQNADNDLLK